MSVIEEIAAERRRQMDVEGWTPGHDDEHGDRSLALAAALYATPKQLFEVIVGETGVRWRDPWPWQKEQKFRGERFMVDDGDGRTKHPPRRRLIIAAALLVAEIERMDRESGARATPHTPDTCWTETGSAAG